MENNQNEEVKVLENTDGSAIVGGEDAPLEPTTTSTEEDSRIASDDDADEEGHAEETAEEAEARKARNRARRQQNKQNRKDYIDGLRRELAARDSIINDLSTRVATVERHGVGSQVAQLDHDLQEAARVYNHFKNVHAQAIQEANGPEAVDAQEKMFIARNRLQMLDGVKKRLINQVQAPSPMDPRVKNNAEQWIRENSWYDPSGKDVDSRIVLTLDQTLMEEGFQPHTPEYWQELSVRVKKHLPHRASLGYNVNKSPNKPRVPVAGGGSGDGNTSSKGYVLSADRVKAIKEAGAWDDPKKRAEAIKYYQEYDRQNG